MGPEQFTSSIDVEIATTPSRIISHDIEMTAARLSDLAPKIRDHKFLVSGGAGFIGSWFSDVAITMGGSIICVDNLIAGSQSNVDHLLANPRFEFHQADITTFQLIESVDYVVHMASIASPPLYQLFPLETLDSGVIGVRNLLAYASEHPVQSFLFTSTSEVYGNPPDEYIPTPETFNGNVSSYGPRSMYDESKRVGEAYCWAYAKEKNVPVRVARIFNTYGPRVDSSNPSQYGRALIKFIHQALQNEPITIYGDGQQTRSFCYINDQLVGLYRLLLTEGVDEIVMNIGNDHEVTIAELAEMIVELSGSESEICYNSPPSYNVFDDPKRRKPDIELARSLLGFSPEVPLIEGLRKTIEWTRTTDFIHQKTV